MSPHACNRFAAALPPERTQSALGVLFILMLFVLVMISQAVGKKFGIKE